MGLDSISAIALGLSLRLVVQASSPPPRIAGTLIGLWEGAVLYHFLERLPSGSLDPYLGLGLRVLLDWLLTASWVRQAIILLWTVAGLVIADATPAFWYDRQMQRFVRRTERQLKDFRLEEFFANLWDQIKKFKWPAALSTLGSWRIPNTPRHARFFRIPPLSRSNTQPRVEAVSPSELAPTSTRTRIVAPGLSTPSISSGSSTGSQTSSTDQNPATTIVASALPSAMRRVASSKSSSSSASVTFDLPPPSPPTRRRPSIPMPPASEIPSMDDPPTPTLTNAPTLASSLPPISAISVPRTLAAPPPVAPLNVRKATPAPSPFLQAASSLPPPRPPVPIPVVSGAMTPPPIQSQAPTSIPMPVPHVVVPVQEAHIGSPGVTLNVEALPEIPPLITPGLPLMVANPDEDGPPPPFSSLDHARSSSFVRSTDEKQGYSGSHNHPLPPIPHTPSDDTITTTATTAVTALEVPTTNVAPDLSAYSAHLRPPKQPSGPDTGASAGAGNRDSWFSDRSATSITGHSRASVLSRADVLRQEAAAEERARDRAAANRKKALNERRYGEAVKLKVEEGERDERARRLHEKAAQAFLKAQNELMNPHFSPLSPGSSATANTETTSTIDVHRLRVREAVLAMERAIRDALLAGGETLRVIVGSGQRKDGKLPVLKLALIRELEDHHLAATVDPQNPTVLIVNLPVT
ncbi:unnamed protein product [Peniophora sp. CBMAI 1063]|nr:unnamed protein product [Peniophora sp. CBMAI 1063]